MALLKIADCFDRLPALYVKSAKCIQETCLGSWNVLGAEFGHRDCPIHLAASHVGVDQAIVRPLLVGRFGDNVGK